MKNIPNKLFVIIIVGFVLRIIVGFYFIDLNNNYYWEYGEISKNILDGKGYSLFYFEENNLEHKYKSDSQTFPSAYMPPGYTYFILPFVALDFPSLSNVLLIIIQSLFGITSVLIIFYITKQIFSQQIAFLASLLAALLPEFIFAVTSFTPTVLFHLLILFFYLIYIKYSDKKTWVLSLALIGALLVFLRSELILFFILFGLLILLKSGIKPVIYFIILLTIFVSPWIIRNVMVFNKFPLIATNSGLNLYRGNNVEGIGSWGEEKTKYDIAEIKRDKNFEVSMNSYYNEITINYILNDIPRFINNCIIKFVMFWTIAWNDDRSLMPIYILTSIFISFFFLIGFIHSFNTSKFDLFYLFFAFSTLISMIFFVQPRYQTMMRIMLIPFVAFGLNHTWEYLKSKLLKYNN